VCPKNPKEDEMKTFKVLPRLFVAFGLAMMFAVSGWGAVDNVFLNLTFTDSPDPVVVQNQITYTVNVENTSSNKQADDVKVTIPLPVGTTYVSGTDCPVTAGNIVCDFGSIGHGNNETLSFIVKAPTSVGTVNADANVTTSDTNTNATQQKSASTAVVLPTVGWENASYQISENTALSYGQTSQLAMNIVLSGAVDYPITVVYQTQDVTAIGDRDYSIAGGTVTIPAGTTSKTVNMYIFHDEAIELDETFKVVLSGPSGTGGVTLRSDRTTAPVLIAEQTTAPLCYDDSFTTTLDSKWRTLFSSGGFTPAISSGHLKLTPGKKNISTAVTKDYEFPSKENLIVIEFQHYAYGGCFEESPASAGLGNYGADGIVAVLYDSAVGASPTPGGYGGSMGYAQRTGINGFQGGWLGLGLDEYGNFANPTEGRVGGTGFHPNAAVIRGDGTGTTGYEFLAEAYPLATPIAPLVDFTNPPKLPGDKFRMTVDARDDAHLYITLERDTAGTYVTVINKFDAKLAGYNQSTTPDFVRFALTAGTGGGCNAHEIDELKVWGRCTPYNPTPGTPPANTGAVDVVDNYPTNGYTTQQGLATKITSKPGNILDAVWLGTAGGGTAVPYYTAGDNNVLDMPVLFYVSDINSTDDNGVCTTERYQLMGANGSPLVATFSAGDIYARTTSTYTVQSNAKQYSKIVPKYINFYGMNLLDPSITCLINSSNSGNIEGMPQCVNSGSQYLAAFGQAAVDRCRSTLNGAPCEPNNHGIGTGEYNHSYGCYQCTLDALGTKGCSSDAFAIRPSILDINSSHIDMPNLLRSAQDYNVSIKAYNYNTTTNTLDYNVTSANTNFTVITTKYNRNNIVDGLMAGTTTFGVGDFNMSNGVSVKSGVVGNEVAGLTFNDVGKINISVQDQNWSRVDNTDTPQDCTVGGAYVCGDKNVTFIPEHFDFSALGITNNNGNPGSFTYIANEVEQMAGRIHTQMIARNKVGGITTNFATFPLWENNVTVIPVVTKSTYLYPDSNETNITNLPIGFSLGAKTIAWDESNTSQDLRFNFRRDINMPQNLFNVNGTDLNITVVSHYIDTSFTPNHTADINGSRLGSGVNNLPYTVVSPADGSSTFVYGRVIPRDIRVFGANTPFVANGWYEVYNTSTLNGAPLQASKNESMWYINALHSDTAASYDGDANVTYVNTTAVNIGGPVGTDGVEDYNFPATYSLGGYKAHINTDPWLWYGVGVLGYADPGMNVNGTVDGTINSDDCQNHPCFNINIVPSIGATGSAKTETESSKSNKSSTSGGGAGWKSTTDYAPAIR